MLDSQCGCVWAACKCICEVWSIMRDEAGEVSKGGTSEDTVNPLKTFPFPPQVNLGNL